jgi:hypothetical protein
MKTKSKKCVMCDTQTTRNHPTETCSLACQARRADFDDRLANAVPITAQITDLRARR